MFRDVIRPAKIVCNRRARSTLALGIFFYDYATDLRD